MDAGVKDDNVPVLVMGGAGFSYQLHPTPGSLPVRDILLRAFDLGLRMIDTSPYYEPSEQLLGAALSHPEVTSRYDRKDIAIMTKVGRIAENEFDYSPGWVRKSVERSLERFKTTYLDCVFCHDVEFVSVDEAVCAAGVLFELKATGVVRRVGISGHNMRTLAKVAACVQERYGRPLDAIQTWAQLTLQNTLAEQWGLDLFKSSGVAIVFCSSPLAVGLLRNGGIPRGLTGDWHPAPEGLRLASQKAAEWTEQQGESMASVALRYAIAKARQNSSIGFSVSTITGISSISDLEQNVQTAKQIMKVSGGSSTSVALDHYTELDEAAFSRDEHLFKHIRTILGHWVDYDFSGNAEKTTTSKDDAELTRDSIIETETIRASM